MKVKSVEIQKGKKRKTKTNEIRKHKSVVVVASMEVKQNKNIHV